MEKAWKRLLGEIYLTALLFTLYNFSASFGIFCLYGSPGSWEFYVSIIESLLYFGLIGLNLWIFITKDETWVGEYKSFFNWNKFSSLYYLFPICERFIVGLLLAAGNVSFASAIASAVVILSCAIIVGVERPYVRTYDNARSITHSAISVAILVLYIVLSTTGPSKG